MFKTQITGAFGDKDVTWANYPDHVEIDVTDLQGERPLTVDEAVEMVRAATPKAGLDLKCVTIEVFKVLPNVHLHTPNSRTYCGAPAPADRVNGWTAYKSDATCEACLATLSS